MHSSQVRRHALELIEAGLSLNAIGKRLGVSRATIRGWRDREDALDADPCPAPPPPTPAYSALLGFYLGDGCVSAHPRTYSLRVACDHSFPGIVEDVRRCIEAVHPERRTYDVSAPGVVVVQSYWKHRPCLFPPPGPGRKHARHLGMTEWQWAIVERYPADFLRGLFHSDGCRVNNWATRLVGGVRKRYEYPRWQFVNESVEIMQWCGEALDLVELPWRQTSRRTLSVSRRDAVVKLDSLIGAKTWHTRPAGAAPCLAGVSEAGGRRGRPR